MPGNVASVGVHWFTAAVQKPVEEVAYVMGALGPPESPGGYGHPHRRVHESGASVYCGSMMATQPVVINAPGEVCEGWWREMATTAVQLGAWCTRLDVALDVEPAEEARRRLIQAHRAFRLGRCSTSMRRDSWDLHKNEREGEGWTLMLGGKSSELRLRIYDRRGPLRIEPQWRPSRVMGEAVPELLLSRGAFHCWRALAGQVRFSLPWYQDLLGADVGSIDHEARVQSAFADAIEQLRQQWGVTLWAASELGMKLEDLARAPVSLRGSQAAKLTTWAASAESMGYDAKKLRSEVKRRCRRSR